MNATLLLLASLHAAPDVLPLRVGSYILELPATLAQDGTAPGAIPTPLPSPEADAMAWLDRAITGDRVRYGPFLGADRLRFTRDLSAVLVTRAPTEAPAFDALAMLVWDRNGNGRLSRRELANGDALLRAWVQGRAADLLTPNPTPQTLQPLADPAAILRSWSRPEAPPTGTADPHQDKLAALIDWALDYGSERDARRASGLDTALGEVIVEVDVLPGPESCLRLYSPDGRSWWDGGRDGALLDGALDLVSGDAPFAGSTWNSVTARWEGYPARSAQWTYELLVDAAHSALPTRRHVAEPIQMEPEEAISRRPGLELEPLVALGERM